MEKFDIAFYKGKELHIPKECVNCKSYDICKEIKDKKLATWTEMNPDNCPAWHVSKENFIKNGGIK